MLKIVSVALFAATVGVAATSQAGAQGRGARASMESCVKTTLSKLAQARAPEAQVGQAVVSRCDGQLRATLAEAINNGEAFICSVESCIGIARSRAAEEAREAYRKIYGSRL